MNEATDNSGAGTATVGGVSGDWLEVAAKKLRGAGAEQRQAVFEWAETNGGAAAVAKLKGLLGIEVRGADIAAQLTAKIEQAKPDVVAPAPKARPKGWVAELEAAEGREARIATGLRIVAEGRAADGQVAEEIEALCGAGREFMRRSGEAEAFFKNPRPQPSIEPSVSEEAEAKPEEEPQAEVPKASTALVVPALSALFVPEAEAQAVREMNDKHAVISNLGGKCVVMEWVPSAITPGAKELSYQSFASFRERYANRYIDLPDGRGRIKSVSRAPLWLAHPQRRQYEGLDLVPNGPEVLPGGYLNLWRGWGVVPRRGSWRLMQRHIAEVLADGDQRFEEGITTEKWMMIEPKNVNAFQWPNRLGILMSGNDRWIVPASHDERRYAVNKISERWKQNRDYFRPLFTEIEDGGAAAMLYDLLQVDLDGWRPSENVPQTRALVEQKMLGLTGLEQWYVHRLNVGELPMPSAKNPRWVMSETLMEDAQDHSPRTKYVTSDELGRFMREMGCEHKSSGKKWGWIFPPLSEAREAWCRRVGGTWEWLTPEIADWGQKPQA